MNITWEIPGCVMHVGKVGAGIEWTGIIDQMGSIKVIRCMLEHVNIGYLPGILNHETVSSSNWSSLLPFSEKCSTLAGSELCYYSFVMRDHWKKGWIISESFVLNSVVTDLMLILEIIQKIPSHASRGLGNYSLVRVNVKSQSYMKMRLSFYVWLICKFESSTHDIMIQGWLE